MGINAIEFHMLEEEIGWNVVALMAIYLQRFSEEWKDELAINAPPSSVENLYELTLRLDSRLLEHCQDQKADDAGHPPEGHIGPCPAFTLPLSPLQLLES